MDKKFLSLFSFDITPYSKEVEYKKGESIFSLGDDENKLVYIFKGNSKCSTIYPDGSTSLLDYAPSPSLYGELELLGIQKYTSNVIAETNCYGYLIDLARCKEKILADPVFLKNLLNYIATKLFRVNQRMADNISLPLKKRLAEYIIKMAKDDIYSENHITTSEYMACTYRHLLFTFSFFEENGALKKIKRGRYKIVDKAKLLED